MNLCILLFLPAFACFSTTTLAQTYTTRFEGEENPLSEGGRWRNAGLDWTNIRKSGGIAFCTQTGTNTGSQEYDDSYAHFSGFPPDQEAWGQAHITKPDAACYQELEILLRWASSPNRTTGYECFARCLTSEDSYLQIVRWEGPLGNYTYLADMRGTNYGLKHGDILKASVVGQVITVYINGVEKARVTDNTYKTGNPGIGMFLHCRDRRSVGSNTNFGFASFSARGIGGTSEANERSTLSPSVKLSKLRVSSNHRYLEDASGQPFFLVGDSPQNLPLKLAVTELDGYMADCETKGFNWLWICIDGQNGHGPAARSPVDKQGNRMMNSDWAIGTLNEKYFATIDAIVKSAERHGQYCAFTPLSERQWSQANINRNSSDKWRDYGRFLGRRYKDKPNILWMIGNDNINRPAQHAIVEGIKDAGDMHLMTVNWRPGVGEFGSAWVRKHDHKEPWIDLNAWYINRRIGEGGSPAYWQKMEYERPNAMPTFPCETEYQQPYAMATDLACRMQNYSVALGGGCGGQVYGAGWLADEWDYETYRNHGGRAQAIHFKHLFTNRDWTSLVPDYHHTFITAGYGTLSTNTTHYVGAAINAGTLGIAYCPTSATLTADMAKFSSGPVKARWYDPVNGNFKDIAGSPVGNAGTREFSTPGANSQGDHDWVLLLEAGR